MAVNNKQNQSAKQLPYAVEYAKSGRACCKSCLTNIAQGTLRMSIRKPSHFFDGLQDNWYHFRCFWPRIKKNEINEASVRGMEFLKWDDQEKVRAEIINNKAQGGFATQKPKVEYAKSSRGKCVQCKKKIEKDVVRMGLRNSYFHVDCFKKLYGSMSIDIMSVDGFNELNNKDIQRIKSIFKTAFEKRKRKRKTSITEEPSERLREDTNSGNDVGKKKLQEQAERIWFVRKCLEDNVNSSGLKALLQANGQEPCKHSVLEQVVDYIVFGCPNKCERCGGQIIFSMSQQTYKCTGYATAYAKCTYTNKNPERKKFVFPGNLLEEVKELSSIKVTAVRERIYYETGEKILRPKTFESDSFLKRACLKEKRQKQVMKHGAVVDPKCEYADVVHVWKDEKGDHWQATLGSADVATNKNSFYKLQLLKHDKEDSFYLFRSWGRIGTIIGGCKTEELSLAEAKDEFMRLFLEKSGNEWKNRTNFNKIPGKMSILETDFIDEKSVRDAFVVVPGSQSKLHPSVQSVIEMIFDTSFMEQTLDEFKIDTKKMPLGKLSRRQILNAYSVLSELQELILKDEATDEQYIDATNRFYTLFPQRFQVGVGPPLLNSINSIKKKTKMLDELMEIEIAYRLLVGDSSCGKKRDPIDIRYSQLHTQMEVLDENSEEYRLVEKYVKNTQAPTHNYFHLEIIDVIRVKREGEEERFRNDIPNKYLLWHGSRTTNFAGILSQGLRIAPKEAPVSGYMFGKGIYFADMVSKSAGYCRVYSGEALLLLCEVALGNMQEEKHGHFIRSLNKGKNSCKGLGKTVPDPEETCTIEGDIKVPLGKPFVTDADDLDLLYNEYIVYDEAQVKLRYLLLMKITS